VYPVQSNIIVDKAYCPTSQEEQYNTGIPDADLVIFLAGNIDLICDKGALAAARSCQADQFDRPVAGSAVICLDEIDVNDDEMVDTYFRVLSHELAHVLGMRK
jgi:leishmanolysin-like peptidase